MAMPGDGDYVIPYGLVPVQVRGEQGSYVEPGVWVLHQLQLRGGNELSWSEKIGMAQPS